jgi:hypothetical protein
MTNDTEALREFIKAAPNGIVYKAFHPAFWHVNSVYRYWLSTVMLKEKDLPAPQSLQLCPGIFQHFIHKRCELRVNVFGGTIIAAQITDQHEIDWRLNYNSMFCAPFDMPPDVRQKVVALMLELGLTMGAIDMILTPGGEYVFLEINEQGQFLWLEEKNPEISLLEPFVSFLVEPDNNRGPASSTRSRISLADYLRSPEMKIFQNTELAALATAPPNNFAVPEDLESSDHSLTERTVSSSGVSTP